MFTNEHDIVLLWAKKSRVNILQIITWIDTKKSRQLKKERKKGKPEMLGLRSFNWKFTLIFAYSSFVICIL